MSPCSSMLLTPWVWCPAGPSHSPRAHCEGQTHRAQQTGLPWQRRGRDGASPALPPQTIQGIQAKCFRTLPDLIGAYQHPNNGLATPLLHPVHGPGPEEDSGEPGRGRGLFRAGSGEGPAELVALPTDGEDARAWGHTAPCPGAAPASRAHIPQQLHQKLQEQVHSR